MAGAKSTCFTAIPDAAQAVINRSPPHPLQGVVNQVSETLLRQYLLQAP